MKFEAGHFYHVYNRSFNRQTVFKTERNYRFFLEKIETLKEFCEIISFCLMPDHFHLLIYVPENSAGLSRLTAPDGLAASQVLARKIGTVLSSYTQAFNKQEKRKGSLFQPKSKA